jgi:hypothetical protein
MLNLPPPAVAARGWGRPRSHEARAAPHAGGDARAPRTCVVQSCCPAISRLTLHQPAPSPVSAIRTPQHPLLPLWEKGVGGMRGQGVCNDQGSRNPLWEKGAGGMRGQQRIRPPHLPPSPCAAAGGRGVREKRHQDAPTPPSPLVGEGGRGDEGENASSVSRRVRYSPYCRSSFSFNTRNVSPGKSGPSTSCGSRM